jgi:death-on-curing protein
MISIKEAEAIHKILIDAFGGSHGARDLALLDSALARPFQTFENVDLHPTPILKAASLIESILINHPFIDGNKRTGYVLMRIFLISNGLDINASQEEKYDFVINIASGQVKFEQIVDWLTKHVVDKNNR